MKINLILIDSLTLILPEYEMDGMIEAEVPPALIAATCVSLK